MLGYLAWMVRERKAVVAEEAGRLVAMAGVTECADRALWIGQMRTHPEFRRRGFATMIIEHVRERAVREGRSALRLYAGHHNVASRALFARTGFREIAGFTRMSAPVLQKDPLPLRADRDGRDAYSRWRGGLFARAGRGYVTYLWHMLPFTRKTARLLARGGHLYVGRTAAVLGWRERGEPAAFASVLAGGVDGLRAARAVAGRLDRGRVEVSLPIDRRILTQAARNGYRLAGWGRHLVLYERRVGGRS